MSEPISKQSKRKARSVSALATATPEEPAPMMQMSADSAMGRSRDIGKVIVDQCIHVRFGNNPERLGCGGPEVFRPAVHYLLQCWVGFDPHAAGRATSRERLDH